MAGPASEPSTGDLRLRDVTKDDLPILFEQQADPEANRMAAFSPRDRDAFMSHWTMRAAGWKILPWRVVQ